MSEMKSRREVLAFIALAELPMPTQINFREPWGDSQLALTIEFDNSGHLLAWVRLLSGADDAQLSRGIDVHKHMLVAYTEYVDWGGYRIMMNADDPAVTPDSALDDATREQLQWVVSGE